MYMIDRLFGRRLSESYDVLMSEDRYDMATLVAQKKRLGKDKVTRSAMKWYDQLLDERNPKLAYDIAVRFNLPEQYVKHAMVEERRLKAMDIEDVSYKLIEKAQTLRLQADEIERSMSPDRGDLDKERFGITTPDRRELKERGERIVADALENGYFFRARDAAKRHGLGKDVFYKMGLLIYEDELMRGNDGYAELIANNYRIKRADKRIITEAVKNRKENNTDA
jgi:hypothetical protein